MNGFNGGQGKSMTEAIELNGEDLTPDHLVAIAARAEVTPCPFG